MKYNFDSILERKGTSCMKHDQCKDMFGSDDVIPMWIADMDFEVGQFITDAIKKRAEHALYGYDFRSDNCYRSIIDWVEKRNGWKIEKDWIAFTPGVVAGLVFGINAFTKEGEGIVIQPPVYPPFAATINNNNRKIINNPLVVKDGKYEIDFEDLDKKLADAKMLMFCNPHNPTGRVFTREELLKVGELCVKHDVYIVSDEIHADLIHKPHKHIHIASLSPEIAKRTVTLIAPSKTFNVAGMATSVLIASDPETRAKFVGEIERIHVGAGNTFGSIVLEAAYRNGEEWLENVMEYINRNIKFSKDYIAENMPKIKSYPTEGTFLLWLNFSELGMSCEQIKDFLVNKAKLALNYGPEFGEEGCQHMRMNLGTSLAVIEQALKQLKKAYDEAGF